VSEVAIEHGTYAGYQLEKRRRLEHCASCRRANAAYKRRWRQANPEGKAAEVRFNMAQSRAVWRMKEIAEHDHPGLFAALMREELGR
jgi:hypothetical protein